MKGCSAECEVRDKREKVNKSTIITTYCRAEVGGRLDMQTWQRQTKVVRMFSVTKSNLVRAQVSSVDRDSEVRNHHTWETQQP